MLRGGGFVIPKEKLPDVFTYDDLSEEQIQIRDTVRRFMSEYVLPRDISGLIESKNPLLTRALMNNLADLGLLGVEIPEEYGGGGLDKISSTLINEEVGKQASFAVSVLAHKGIGTWPIILFGTPEQKQKYLPSLANGERIASYALTENSAGSDANAAKTTAILSHRDATDSDGYMLNGEKVFVSNGGFADIFTVFAKLNGKLTTFIVEKSFSGVKIGKEEHKMGIQGSSTVTLILENVFVPKKNLLGEPGKGFKIAMNVLNLGRLSLGAACLGASRLCLEEAAQYARERKQFGRPIANFGLVKEKLAKMKALIFAMESIIYRTAGIIENSLARAEAGNTEAALKAVSEYAIECSLVKIFCSEALDYIVDENVQIHGGNGFCEEGYTAARYYRDSRINRIFEGTNEINRIFAVGELFKRAESLGLLAVIKQVVEETMSGPVLNEESENPMERLTISLNGAKKALLLTGGTIAQKYPRPEDLAQALLVEHQFVSGQICDCIIDIYVLESILAVLTKSQPNKAVRREPLVRLIFAETIPLFENRLKNIFAACVEDDDLRTRLAMLRRLLKVTPENMEVLHDQILKD